jgi:hypothetical protein
MRHRLRTCISVLLMFALLGTMAAHAAMVLPMGMQGGVMHYMQGAHGAVVMTANLPEEQGAPHSGQHQQCPCGGSHCGLCGTCHFSLPTTLAANFIGMSVTHFAPRSANPAEVWLPLDPRPPRA